LPAQSESYTLLQANLSSFTAVIPHYAAMQTQTSWQGYTDAGNKWYFLLCPVIEQAGFAVSQA